MDDPITADGRDFSSAAALARTVGVHRDQVRQWRLNGGPSSLNLGEWRRWLLDTGRPRYAEAIPATLAAAAEDAPPGAAQQTIQLEVKAEDEGVWKARAARAKALEAERELAASEGRLIERKLVTVAIARLGAAVVDCLLRSESWDRLAPTLDGLTPTQRQAMRTAFERWSIEFRSRLAILPAHVCADVLPPETP
jgi:hypothetical protein